VLSLRTSVNAQADRTERPFPKGPVVKTLNSVLRTVVFVSVVWLVSTAALGQSSNLCSASARGALRSCQAGARSNYLLALAKCANESDEADRSACRNQAQADLKTQTPGSPSVSAGAEYAS
jgi:hypothetical protein